MMMKKTTMIMVIMIMIMIKGDDSDEDADKEDGSECSQLVISQEEEFGHNTNV